MQRLGKYNNLILLIIWIFDRYKKESSDTVLRSANAAIKLMEHVGSTL